MAVKVAKGHNQNGLAANGKSDWLVQAMEATGPRSLLRVIVDNWCSKQRSEQDNIVQ